MNQIEFSFQVAKDFNMKPSKELIIAMAVFEKIAPPAVYLEHVYEGYLDKIEREKEIDVCEEVLSD